MSTIAELAAIEVPTGLLIGDEWVGGRVSGTFPVLDRDTFTGLQDGEPLCPDRAWTVTCCCPGDVGSSSCGMSRYIRDSRMRQCIRRRCAARRIRLPLLSPRWGT